MGPTQEIYIFQRGGGERMKLFLGGGGGKERTFWLRGQGKAPQAGEGSLGKGQKGPAREEAEEGSLEMKSGKNTLGAEGKEGSWSFWKGFLGRG